MTRIDAKIMAQRQAFQVLMQYMSETADEDLAPQCRPSSTLCGKQH